MFAALEERILRPINQMIKKAVTSAILALFSLIFFSIAVCFFSFAAYSFLVETRDPVNAALIVGGSLIGLTVLLVIAALIIVRSKKQTPIATISSQAPAALERPGIPFRTGYPLVDVAQFALPLFLPLRQQAHDRIKERPLSASLLTLAGGVIAGFFLLSRRPTLLPSRKGRR